MLQSRWEGLLGHTIRLEFRGGYSVRGVLKQDKKGYVLVEDAGHDIYTHYFEPDEVAAITERVPREGKQE